MNLAGGIIGRRIEDLDTPALLLDDELLQGNLQRMAEFFRGRPAQLRPHFKNHKCATLARMQLAAGSAVGMTCAKLAEAEVLVNAGVSDILIANQVVGANKCLRLAAIARRASIRVAVDSMAQVRPIAEAATSLGATVGLLVEVDIGMGRCGVEPGEPALGLAREITGLKGGRVDGPQADEGHLVATAGREERRASTLRDMGLAVETRRLIERAGTPVAVISGGSTSTYDITGGIEGVDEVQAGTYATMDHMYKQLAPEFGLAMSVLSRVISRTRADRAILDVGLKGLGHEFGDPVPRCLLSAATGFKPPSEVTCRLSEEHCTVAGPLPAWRVGDAVELIPSHSCTTSALYRRFIIHSAGRVVGVWPIEGAGMLE